MDNNVCKKYNSILENKSAIIIGSIARFSKVVAEQIELMGADVYIKTTNIEDSSEKPSMLGEKSKDEDFLIVLFKNKSSK